MAFLFPLGGWFLGGGPPATPAPGALYPRRLYPGRLFPPRLYPGTSIATRGYHVYANGGAGGPVDYATPVFTTTGLSCPVGPLDYGSDWTFAVRAYSGSLEEQNVDARVRVLVSAAGVDLASLPNAATNLRALPGPGGTATVSWAYSPRGQGAPPTHFHVYKGTPAVSYGSPAATVAYTPGAVVATAALSGLSGGLTYRVAVRAFNATGEEQNADTAAFVASTLGPRAAIDLVATIIS